MAGRLTGSGGACALPAAGEVLEVDTYVFANGDHADHRWVVVVRPPRDHRDYLTVIQRSSTNTEGDGVNSPLGELDCFTKPGRWILAYQRTARWEEVESAIQHRCGRLASESVRALVVMWEAS